MEIVQLYRAIIIVVVVISSLIAFAFSTDTNQELNSDIALLASAMPGCYSNAKQYYAHALSRMSRQKRPMFLLRAEFYKMETPVFNDSLTVYFQDFTKSSKIPFTSGFYSFTPDPETNTIRMKVYKFRQAVPGLKISLSNYSIPEGSSVFRKLTEALDRSQLKTHASCDMLWKRISVKTFMGVTRAACLASLGKDSVRISVSMTLTSSRITLTEGWYDVDDRARLRELKIPYVLKRKLANPANPVSRPVARPKILRKPEYPLKAKENRIRENLSTYKALSKNGDMFYSKAAFPAKSKASGAVQNTEARKRSLHNRKRRILRSFRHVKSSLLTGHRVFYKVDLSGCSLPANVPISRLSFGGEITKFLVMREKYRRKRKTKIYFSTSKTSMGARGVETVQREIIIHRGGRVEVTVTKRLRDPRRLQKQFTFQCKLYKNKKRKGSVKIFTNTSPRPREAANLSQMTKLLDQGRRLWLVADFTNCQGRRADTTIMVGSEISDYDLVNKGKAMEVFLPINDVNSHKSKKRQTSGFVIQILKRGDVILTWVSDTNEAVSRNKLGISPAYQCELTNHFMTKTNESPPGGVGVFYS